MWQDLGRAAWLAPTGIGRGMGFSSLNSAGSSLLRLLPASYFDKSCKKCGVHEYFQCHIKQKLVNGSKGHVG